GVAEADRLRLDTLVPGLHGLVECLWIGDRYARVPMHRHGLQSLAAHHRAGAALVGAVIEVVLDGAAVEHRLAARPDADGAQPSGAAELLLDQPLRLTRALAPQLGSGPQFRLAVV